MVDNGSWPTALVTVHDATPVPDELARWIKDAIGQVGPERVGLASYETAPLDVLLDAWLTFQTGDRYTGRFASWILSLRRILRR